MSLFVLDVLLTHHANICPSFDWNLCTTGLFLILCAIVSIFALCMSKKGCHVNSFIRCILCCSMEIFLM